VIEGLNQASWCQALGLALELVTLPRLNQIEWRGNGKEKKIVKKSFIQLQIGDIAEIGP
jgi:hypothetical protein